jgi:iron complex transport system substrate-binding protein
LRIISLQPFAADLLGAFGVGWDLVGITHIERAPDNAKSAVTVTAPKGESFSGLDGEALKLAAGLCAYPLDVKRLFELLPDTVLAEVRAPDKERFILWAEDYFYKATGRKVAIKDLSVNSLDGLYQVIEDLGALVGGQVEARNLVNKIKSQIMSWGHSFFDRSRGKLVVVISDIDPLRVEGRWFPDLIKALGARTIEFNCTDPARGLSWADVVAARPNTIIYAPENQSLEYSVKGLNALESLPNWEDLPAVKRGDVIFAAGRDIYRPGPRFLKGTAILVSAIAGLDSGYITERDEYFKVRYLELHRHRFV